MKARILVLLAASLVGACVDNNTQALLILQNQIPTMELGICTSPGGSTAFRVRGRLDLSLYDTGTAGTQATSGYLVFPSVLNNLGGSIGNTTLNTNTDALNIQVTRADIQVTDADSGQDLIAPFSVPTFKLMKPDDTIGLILEVIPLDLIPALRDGQLVFARVQIVGNRDGSEIKSNTMEFPISICSGCLVSDGASCDVFSGTATGNICNIAQDDPIDCCLDADGARVCPGVRTGG